VKKSIIALVILTVFEFISHGTENLIPNGGFEKGKANWSTIKLGQPDYKRDFLVDDKIFHGGRHSAEFKYISGSATGYAWFSQKIPVNPGRTCELSLWARRKGDGRPVNFVVHVHMKNRPLISFRTRFSTCDKWEKNVFYFKIPTGVKDINLALVASKTGTVYIDDIALKYSQLPPNIIERESSVFVPVSEDKETCDFNLKSTKSGNDFVIYQRMAPRRIKYTSIPQKNELKDELNLVVTPDEFEPLWFSIYAAKKLTEVSLNANAVFKSSGRQLKPDIDVRVLNCWPQRTDWNSRNYSMVSELLEKKSSITVPAGNSRTFWLTFKIPEQAVPGIYKGSIILNIKKKTVKEIPVSITVLPFRLKQPPGRYWAMWTSDNYRKSLNEYKRELQDMKDHGINTLLLYPQGLGDCRFAVDKKGKISFNSPTLRKLQNIRRETGLNGPLLLYWGGGLKIKASKLAASSAKLNLKSKALRKTFIDLLKAVDDFVKETGKNGFSEWYYLGTDEPQIWRGGQQSALFEHTAARMAGIKNLVTINESAFTEKLSRYMTGICWGGAPNSVEANVYRKNMPCEYWWYGTGVYTGQEGGLMPNRYYCGALFYKSGAIGEVSFVYQRLEKTGDPFDDFDANKYSEPKDAYIVYPAENGKDIIPTLQWEGIREGIDDYKYIYTLEELIKENKKHPRTRNHAEKTEKKLKELLSSCPWGIGGINSDDPFKVIYSNEKAAALRKDVISMILSFIPETAVSQETK